ncbi:hypothetical protein Q3G72_023708 [Acer saccharum]|nr:hypothetical protein Q3G72_023708 [Acer saccharum]
MGPEEIARLCVNMTLLEKEGPVRRLQDGLKIAGMQGLALSLVGKVLTNKMVHREAFMGVMGRVWSVWKVAGRVEMEFVSTNVYTFHFNSIEDQQKVLSGGPWTFDGTLLVLEEPAGRGDQLSGCRFIRCHCCA